MTIRTLSLVLGLLLVVASREHLCDAHTFTAGHQEGRHLQSVAHAPNAGGTCHSARDCGVSVLGVVCANLTLCLFCSPSQPSVWTCRLTSTATGVTARLYPDTAKTVTIAVRAGLAPTISASRTHDGTGGTSGTVRLVLTAA